MTRGAEEVLLQLFLPGLEAGQTFPQVWQSFVFGGLGGLGGIAFFSLEPLRPFWPISSSEEVAGSACGGGHLAALPGGL